MVSVANERALGFGGLASELREVYDSGRTKDMEWRQSQLRGLLGLLREKEEEIFEVLREDLGKHRGESFRDEVRFPMNLRQRSNSASCSFFWLISPIPFRSGWSSGQVRRRQAAKLQEVGGSREGKLSP
jgi:hypothetical protein